MNPSTYSHLGDVAIVVPSEIDRERRHLEGEEESEEQLDAGADPAILMHMLHRNIDQLFSLRLPQDRVIVCLCLYCLNCVLAALLKSRMETSAEEWRRRPMMCDVCDPDRDFILK